MAMTDAARALGDADVSAEVTMHDGLQLPLRAWFPDGPRPWPVVLDRWYDTTPPGHDGASA